jgi:predicted ABC-type transport system involved in lysophospholipase L1 biosynthesis ATPase subunit
MSDLIKAESIHKTYTVRKKAVNVLRGASITVKAGETVSIVGASGAGKSTLLHLLGGLDQPDSGHVFIDGKDIFALPSSARTGIRATTIGFVFQSYHLLPEMTVVENVMLPAMTAGAIHLSRNALRKRAIELLSAVGLAERGEHTPMELSGGEQQRVALARAVMNDPRIVLADEPTGNLDERTGRQVLDYLFGLTKLRGHALLLVTHNRAIAEACDRVLTLSNGILTK